MSFSSFGQYAVGLKGGVNVADMYGSSISNNSSLMGFNGGIILNYCLRDAISSDFGKNISFQAEVLVENKGTVADFKYEDIQNNVITVPDAEYKLTFVTVPILARVAFGENFKFALHAGPYFSGLFGMTIDGEKARDHDYNPATDDRKYREEYAAFDIGIAAGAGIEYPFSDRFSLVVDGRYNYGMVNMGEEDMANQGNIPKDMLKELKTTAISASAGVVYHFDIKR
jgi:hypothetical protein